MKGYDYYVPFTEDLINFITQIENKEIFIFEKKNINEILLIIIIQKNIIFYYQKIVFLLIQPQIFNSKYFLILFVILLIPFHFHG